MGKIVYIDGMDCCGKSAAIDILMDKEIFSSRSHRAMCNNPFVSKFIDTRKRYAWNSVEVAKALLAAVNYDIEAYYSRNDYDDNWSIQESTILVKGFCMLLSDANFTIQHHEIIERFFVALTNHPKFNVSFFITTDKKTRLERIQKRIRETNGFISRNDALILQDYDFFAKVDDSMRILMETYFDAKIIDTTNLSPNEVSNIILQTITPYL